MAARLPGWAATNRSIAAALNDTLILPPVAYASGYARLARGEYQGALVDLRNAAEHDPLLADPATPVGSAETLRRLGLASWTKSRDAESIAQLERAIRTNPRDERSRLALSRVLSAAGRDAESERVLLDAIAAIPDSVQAHWWLAADYERLQRPAEARLAYERAAAGAVAGHAAIHGAIGRLATQAGDLPAAVDAFTRAVAAQPDAANLRKSLATLLLQVDRADDALVHLRAALTIDPLDAGAHAGIGQIHLNAGRPAEAIAALGRAVELSPGNTTARYALAAALMQAGRTAAAEREFARVEQAQREAVENRRRTMRRDVEKEQEALRK